MKSVFKASISIIILIIIPFIFLSIFFATNNFNKSNFSKEEIELINSANNNEAFDLLNSFIENEANILKKRSSKIIFFDDDNLDKLIDRLFVTVANKNNLGVGIASPQVGILKRVILVKRFDKEDNPFEVYLNPVIISYSDTLRKMNVVCLSIPNINGTSYRHISIEIYYTNIKGESITEKINHQYTAHIFQHEIDHLDGILWTDAIRQTKEDEKYYY